MYFKVTSAGSLSATRTLTIAPNTISRVMFIENATSGSQSIAISQGSGANVTILTGKTAVVYLDGAGSGAAVVDAMAGVDPGVTDTLAEVLTAGNTTTTDQKIQFRDTGIYINSSADGQLDIVADTEIQIAATTVDLNGNLDVSGTALVTGVLTANAGVVVDNFTLDGTTLALSSGSITLDSAGQVIIDGDDEGTLTLKNSGTQYGILFNQSNDFKIKSLISDGDIVFLGNDGGVGFTALTLDMSEAGAATFNAGATFGGSITATAATAGSDSANGLVKTFTADIGNGETSGINLYNSAGSDTSWFITPGVTGLNNTDFCIRDGTNNVNALTLAVSSGAATFNSTLSTGNMTISGQEIDVSQDDLTLDVAGNIFLNADGSLVVFADGAVEYGRVGNSSSDFAIQALVQDKDIVFKGNDNGTIITALTLDMSNAGTAIFNHDIEMPDAGLLRMGAGGDLILTSDGTNGLIYTNNGNLTLDVAGGFAIDVDGGQVSFSDGGTLKSLIDFTGNNVEIQSRVSDGDLLFRGVDGASFITALTLDMSAAGLATFNSGINIGNRGDATNPTLQSSIDPNTGIFWAGNDILGLASGGRETLRVDSNGSIFGNSANGLTRFANLSSNYLAIADDATLQLIASTCGATFIYVYDQGAGDGGVFFVTYKGQPILVASQGSSAFSTSDVDGSYCIIKSNNSHSVSFKNRTGSTRQMVFLLAGANIA
jgi:hypothetical protein